MIGRYLWPTQRALVFINRARSSVSLNVLWRAGRAVGGESPKFANFSSAIRCSSSSAPRPTNSANKFQVTDPDQIKSDDENATLYQQAEELQKSLSEPILTDINQFRANMEPLAKNFFLGTIDKVIFSYPDVLPNDRYFGLEKRVNRLHQVMNEKATLLEETLRQERRIPKDILYALRSQGFYALDVGVEEGGEGLCVTETTRMFEELASINLSLSETVASSVTFGNKAIQKFGTEDQKSRYLPQLRSGQATMALCMADEAAGSDPMVTKMRAIHIIEENFFELTGKKTWVTNAPSANYFIVLANVFSKGEGGVYANKLTAFLVDRRSPGVSVDEDNRVDTIGLRGVQVCPVSFDKTPVLATDVLGGVGQGMEILANVFAEQRLYSAVRLCAGLRNLLNLTVDHTLKRKCHGNRIAKYDLVRQKISQSSIKLFALESAIYMAAGLADYQKEPDVNIEYAMCKYFAIQVSKQICETCSGLFGSSTFVVNHPVQNLINDLKSFHTWESTEEILSIFIGLAGVSFAGLKTAEGIYHLRNPFGHPKEMLRTIFSPNLAYREPKLILGLNKYLHPSLLILADELEKILLRFGAAVRQLLVREGSNVSLREIEQKRLADISTQIFVLSSLLARASRSYSGGNAHAQLEVYIAVTYINEVKDNLHRSLDELLLNVDRKNDRNHFNVADYVNDNGYYPCVHPMTKNFF